MKLLKLSRPAPALMAGIGAVLAGGIVIAALSLPGRSGGEALASTGEEVSEPVPLAAPAKKKCAECGVIESTREIVAIEQRSAVNIPVNAPPARNGESKAAKIRNYEITIRLQDGSRRVITDANSATWRHGDRVKLIAGAQ